MNSENDIKEFRDMISNQVERVQKRLDEIDLDTEDVDLRMSTRIFSEDAKTLYVLAEEFEKQIVKDLTPVWDQIRIAYEAKGIFQAILIHRRSFGSGLLAAKTEIESRASSEAWYNKNL